MNGEMENDGKMDGQPQGIAPTDNPTTDKAVGDIIGAFKSITSNPSIFPSFSISPFIFPFTACLFICGCFFIGATTRVAPTISNIEWKWLGIIIYSCNFVFSKHNPTTDKTVGDIIGAFKSITSNEYIRGVKNNNWQRFEAKLWQRNYWEHIIRNISLSD
jgi:hypothetical protein